MNLRTMETEAAEWKFALQFENISLEEMCCKCGECLLPIKDPEFINFCIELQDMRTVLGFPFHFTSFYRCSIYNRQVSSTGPDGPHTKGAADILVSFERMYVLVREAIKRDMGVGIKQHGDIATRFIHIDALGRRLWSYGA